MTTHNREHPVIGALMQIGYGGADRECLQALLAALIETDSAANEEVSIHLQAAAWRLQKMTAATAN